MKKIILSFFLYFTLFNSIFAQVKEYEILSKDKTGEICFIKFEETKISSDINSVKDFLKRQYKYDDFIDFSIKENSISKENEIQTQKLQQYYLGIKVEFGEIVVASKNNKLRSINGKFLSINNLNIIPTISESEALNRILNEINAEKYAWEDFAFENMLKSETNYENATYFPKGELVILDKDLYDDNSEPTLVYKFDIYSLKPISRAFYYIDATDGKLLFTDAIIKHVNGPASTRYSGTRTIETSQNGSTYRLRDFSRGNGIETFNMNNGTSYSNAIDFVDNDNNWTSTEFHNSNKDDAALDAHWGAEMTYDYFLQKHSRNSYNGNGGVLRSYVHADLIGMGYQNNDNAFWDGEKMTYGDGQLLFDAVTSIDIVAHEIGHGVCSTTAQLVYQNESGAINESLSDIWGSMVEFYAAPEKDNYLLGEDITSFGIPLRSMLDPNSGLFPQPDTYHGTFWHFGASDNGGVHTNSGIMNYWFYLLAEGGSGINDIGNSFNIIGIGKEKAAKIIYRAESNYFTSSTNFEQARLLTIQAANDLFESNSIESYNTALAWYAVGVGPFPNSISYEIQGATQLTPGLNQVYTINPYPNATEYIWTIPTGCQYNYCWGIIGGQGTRTISIKAGSIGTHEITCKIYNGNTLISSKYKLLYVQNPYSGGEGNDPCGGFELINGVIYPPIPCDNNSLTFENVIFKKVAILNTVGQTIFYKENVEFIDLNTTSSGIYIIKAELSNNTAITKKIIL